jgi:triphosphoribosyl-dephospho-CoA synthase
MALIVRTKTIEYTGKRETEFVPDQIAANLAGLVVSALIDEATLTPKPGLVDMRGRGAHVDLSWGLMCDSALALRPAFYAMAVAGSKLDSLTQLREKIGQLGRDGEHRMTQVTGGVNTHRGAIWALGLLVTAAAQDLSVSDPHSVARRAARLAQTGDQFAPARTGNKGELACLTYKVGGARAQAQTGFPFVVDVALPCLTMSRQRGDSETTSRLNALLAVMAMLDDTCVLSRGGSAALASVQAGARQVLALGGAASAAGKLAFKNLEAELLHRHISPGGAADMLAAALFLDRLHKEPVWKN